MCERIEECKDCDEEACVCEHICKECGGWKISCPCYTLNPHDVEEYIKGER